MKSIKIREEHDIIEELQKVRTGNIKLDHFIEKWSKKIAGDEKLEQLLVDLVNHVKTEYRDIIPEFQGIIWEVIVEMLPDLPESFHGRKFEGSA